MRVTPELLFKLAKENIQKRSSTSLDIIAAYITGSVLSAEPLLGGTTDIDVVIVHKEEPEIKREIIRISHEISLDVAHHHQSYYAFHRQLRLDPWIGHAVCNHAGMLYDTDHWLEFIQSSVSAQFDRPEYRYGRSYPLAEKARSIWFNLEEQTPTEIFAWLELYLKALSLASNSLAALNGPALTTRRFLIELPARLEQINRVDLFPELLKLIGLNLTEKFHFDEWQEEWEKSIVQAGKMSNYPLDIHPARRSYYFQSCLSMAESGLSHSAFWLMLNTWLLSTRVLWDQPEYKKESIKFINFIGFNEESYESNVSGLDNYLDQVESVLENYKNANGL